MCECVVWGRMTDNANSDLTGPPFELDDEAVMPGRLLCSVVALGRLLNVNPETIRKHRKAGNAVRVRHGLYDLVESCRRIYEHMRRQASGRHGRETGVDAVTENALLRRAQRELMELKRKQLDGSLISIPEMQELWIAHVNGVKQMVLAWPERVALELPHLTAHDISVMKRIASEVLRANTLESAMPIPDPPRELA